MAIKLNPKTQTTTGEYRIFSFQINTPPIETPVLNAQYGSVTYGESGNVIAQNQYLANLHLPQSQLTGLLTDDNKWGLPSYSSLYVGLKSFFDDQFKVHFSGSFPLS